MDITQLSQMVNWLDEELRRERAEVTKLQQLVERQSGELTEQARQIRELEGHLANTRAQIVQFSRFDENLQQVKTEVVLMLEEAEQRRRQDRRESEGLRISEREKVSSAVNELRKELQHLPRYDEGLRLREAEDRRLSEALITLRHEVSSMGKDFDERVRNVSYLSEQRAYDNKRISTLQEENLVLIKRTEAQDTELKSVADATLRHERQLQELQLFRTEFRRQQADWMESQLLVEEDRKREMVEWRQEVEAQHAVAQDIAEQMREFTEAAALGRQIMGTMEGFKEQVRRDQNQVAELQRLAEERQRKELEEWQGEDEKRWKKHEMQWEHQWKEQYERHNALVARFAGLEEEVKASQEELARLWRVNEVFAAHRLGEVQRWQSEMGKAIAERDRESRKRR